MIQFYCGRSTHASVDTNHSVYDWLHPFMFRVFKTSLKLQNSLCFTHAATLSYMLPLCIRITLECNFVPNNFLETVNCYTYLAIHQQVAQQNWHQDQEDDPEKEWYRWEGYLILTLPLVVYVIIIQFSSGHGHHLHYGSSRVGEGSTLEEQLYKQLIFPCVKLC